MFTKTAQLSTCFFLCVFDVTLSSRYSPAKVSHKGLKEFPARMVQSPLKAASDRTLKLAP